MFLNILTAMYLQAHVRTFILHGENITILNCAKLFTFNKFTSNIDGQIHKVKKQNGNAGEREFLFADKLNSELQSINKDLKRSTLSYDRKQISINLNKTIHYGKRSTSYYEIQQFQYFPLAFVWNLVVIRNLLSSFVIMISREFITASRIKVDAQVEYMLTAAINSSGDQTGIRFGSKLQTSDRPASVQRSSSP